MKNKISGLDTSKGIDEERFLLLLVVLTSRVETWRGRFVTNVIRGLNKWFTG